MTTRPTRRQTLIGAGLLAGLASGSAAAQTLIGDPATYAAGRLRARPGPPTRIAPSGQHTLGLDRQRDGVLFVPEGLDPTTPAPLLLALHGHGDAGIGMARALREEAQARGIVIVAPDSRRATWTLDNGGPVGPDAAFIDRALEATFQQVSIDPARIGVLGFSDGASYALSMGMANGDLFSHILALAPLRFVAPVSVGHPPIFISIGRRDDVSRLSNVEAIARQLEGFGYTVEMHRHARGHAIDRIGLGRGLDRFLA
jgi:phospholipase/carboxylesterase